MSKRDKDKAARGGCASGSPPIRSLRERLEAVVPAATLAAWEADKRTQLDPARLGRWPGARLELPCIEVEDFRRAGLLARGAVQLPRAARLEPRGEGRGGARPSSASTGATSPRTSTLERVGRGNARFDIEKLWAFNQEAIAALSEEAFFEAWTQWCARYAADRLARDEAWRRRYAAMIRTRCRTLADAASEGGPGGFVWVADDALCYDEKAMAKHLRKGDPSGAALLEAVRPVLAEAQPFEPAPLEAAVQAFCASRGIGLGRVAQPLRVATTGGAASPPLGDTLAILGRDAVLRRIDRCLAALSR
jgi:hypothetical protein